MLTKNTTVEDWLGKDNTLGIDICKRKYLYGDEDFYHWLFTRVAKGNKKLAETIYKKEFLFGGRILSNRELQTINENIKVTYSNCYVVSPPEDNLESIFDCASRLARTFSYGGGVGIDISKLSPAGAKINNAAKETSGAVSFMDLYSMITGLIGQNNRRGALMISLDCHHPDLVNFIKIKTDLDRVTKANISIRVTEDFLKAAENNEEFILSFKREETGEEISSTVNAREILHLIAETNWNYAEPGFLYWDRISNWNLMSNTPYFSYAGVNPCAEEPLPAGGSCLLGSINLSAFVRGASFDYKRLKTVVRISVDALNEVLDDGLELHPLQEQRESVSEWRQIGLGIFGLADMLIKMGIKYGSQESLDLCDKLGKIIVETAVDESALIAKDKGPFTCCNRSDIMKTEFFKSNITDEKVIDNVEKYGLRNSQLLTIAPTGSLSTMIGVSGGIEPIFANYYTRKTESLDKNGDRYYKVYTPIVEDFMRSNNLKDDSELPDYFVTSKDINYKDRINMQSVWQKYIDASISSTVNVPNDFRIEDVEDLYLYAGKAGLKGVTIYRDGCARSGILTTSSDNEQSISDENMIYDSIEPITRKELGDILTGHTYIKEVACGKMYITINHDQDGNIVEVFVDSGKSGGCSANAECLGRYASATLRSGVKVQSVVDITKGVKCSACTAIKGSKSKHIDGISCGDCIAKTIEQEYQLLKKTNVDKENENHIPIKDTISNDSTISKNICPECHQELEFSGGCNVCPNCGWSKCN